MKEDFVNVKKDCFAYKRGYEPASPHCEALNKLYCETEECKFYKKRGKTKWNFLQIVDF